MSDERIELRGLRVLVRCGNDDTEREVPQPLEIDLDVVVDLTAAGASDDLADTVDYGTLARDVLAVVEGEPVDLIETLAQRIAEVCLVDARVQWTEVTVHKPDAPIEATFADVALTIHRSR